METSRYLQSLNLCHASFIPAPSMIVGQKNRILRTNDPRSCSSSFQEYKAGRAACLSGRCHASVRNNQILYPERRRSAGLLPDRSQVQQRVEHIWRVGNWVDIRVTRRGPPCNVFSASCCVPCCRCPRTSRAPPALPLTIFVRRCVRDFDDEYKKLTAASRNG